MGGVITILLIEKKKKKSVRVPVRFHICKTLEEICFYTETFLKPFPTKFQFARVISEIKKFRVHQVAQGWVAWCEKDFELSESI